MRMVVHGWGRAYYLGIKCLRAHSRRILFGPPYISMFVSSWQVAEIESNKPYKVDCECAELEICGRREQQTLGAQANRTVPQSSSNWSG